jgi:hypothetical protein
MAQRLTNLSSRLELFVAPNFEESIMTLKIVQPLVESALARLRLVQEGLDGLEQAIKRNDRSVVLGGLMMAQDNLGPMNTLIDAAILLAKEHANPGKE